MRLGSFIVRHRKSVLITYIVAILIAGGIGSLSFSRLDSGGYSDLNSESAKAANYITDTFKVQDPVAILVVDSGSRSVDDPTVVAEAASLEREKLLQQKESSAHFHIGLQEPPLHFAQQMARQHSSLSTLISKIMILMVMAQLEK